MTEDSPKVEMSAAGAPKVEIVAPPGNPGNPPPGQSEGAVPSQPSAGPGEPPLQLPIAGSGSGFSGAIPFNPPPPPPPDLGRTGWRGPPGSNGRPKGSKKSTSAVMWWYERLADWMIANPHLTMKDAALHFQKSHYWILQLKNSDTFQRYWRERSGMASAELVGGIKSKAYAASEAALDILNDKLETMPETFTVGGLLEVVDTTMKRFGYEVNAKSAAPTVNVNVGLVTPSELQAARERMRDIERKKDAQVLEAIEGHQSAGPVQLPAPSEGRDGG